MWQRLKMPVIVGTIIYAVGAWAFVSEGEATLAETLIYWPLAILAIVFLGWFQRMKRRAFEAGLRGGPFTGKPKRNDGMQD
jgi:hypothetical protein